MSETQPETATPLVKRGRPSVYSDEVARHILAELSSGKSLRSVCADEKMPNESTVRSWALDNQGGFFAQYSRAKLLQQFAQIEEIGDIADAAPEYITETVKIGQEVREERRIDPGFEKWRSTKIATRQWLAGKLLPGYSDKMQVNHRVTIDPRDIPTEELAAIVAQARLTIEGQAVSVEAPEDAE